MPIITFTATKDYDLCFSNDVGGTASAPPGVYEIAVERTWDDYEIGRRGVGRLTKESDIAKLKELGTTPYDPKKLGWDPAEVFFSMDGKSNAVFFSRKVNG